MFISGPGPNQYLLKNTVGTEDVDPTFKSAPAFKIGEKNKCKYHNEAQMILSN